MVAMRRSGSNSTRHQPGPAEVLGQVKKQAAEAVAEFRSGAIAAKKQVQQQVADVTHAINEAVRDEAERLFEERREQAANKVKKVGKAVRQAAQALHAVRMNDAANYAYSAARQVEGVSSYIKERNLTQITQDAEEVVRRHRGVVVGGLFVAGFALARFLKASEDEATDGEQGREETEEDQEDESESRGRRGR